MANRDDEALPARDGLGLGQSAAHRVGRLVVIEEDVARHGGHAQLLCSLLAHCLRRRARVEEHQAARLEELQHGLHAGFARGEAAAHVVVDADIAIETVERGRDSLLQLGVAQRHQKRAGAGIGAAHRFHRQMQHQLLPAGVSRPRLLVQTLGIRQERHGERPRQFPGALRMRAIEAHVVDHDGNQRLGVEIGERHGVTLPRGLRRRRRGCSGDLRRAWLLFDGRHRLLRFLVARQSGDLVDRGVLRGGRRRRALLHILQGVARQPVTIRRIEMACDPVATDKTADKQHDDADGDRVPAMGVDPRFERRHANHEPFATGGRRFRTLSVRLPASVLLRRHLSD